MQGYASGRSAGRRSLRPVPGIGGIDFKRPPVAPGNAPLTADRWAVLEPAAPDSASAAKCRTSSRGHGHETRAGRRLTPGVEPPPPTRDIPAPNHAPARGRGTPIHPAAPAEFHLMLLNFAISYRF